VAVRERPSRGAPGQHFLRSSRLAAGLVRDAGIEPGRLVVDVGAGTGMLTRALVEAGARVVALEADPALATTLRRRFDGASVDVVETDARRWSWPREPFSVVSNLPFAGSGEILGGLLRDPHSGLVSADVIVQWELAAKQAAVWPATMRATYWRAWFDVGIVARLARSAFSPPPRVDAAVLCFARRARPLVPPEEHDRYRRLLDGAFAAQAPLQRALRGALSQRELRRAATVLGFDPRARARDLDARQWAGLYELAATRGRNPQKRPRTASSSAAWTGPRRR
jgi:23S rRNA (adenine-N6)-dimethyltransferase